MGKVNGRGRTRREGAKLLARRREVFERWCRNETQTAIARSLKLSVATVHCDIGLALQEWRESHRGSIAEHVEFELKRIHDIDREIEQEWDKTRDPRFSDQMLGCSDRRRKLLGLDAPSRSEVTAEVSTSRTFIPKAEMLARCKEARERFRIQKLSSEEQNDDS